jgi:hypothetical protein
MIKISLAIALLACMAPALACVKEFEIEHVLAGGRFVKLSDGSVWEVEDGDEEIAILWTHGEKILACNNKLININEDRTVDAKQIRK